MALQGSLLKIFNNCRICIYSSRPALAYFQPNAGLKTETKKKLEQLKLPEKPKKPLTPYFRFVRDQREDLMKKFPHLKVTDVTKKCAEEWKDAHITIKEKYQISYKEELDDYYKKLEKYKLSLSDEQKDFLSEVSKEKTDDKKRRKLRQRYKETNKPRKPMGSFMMYAMDQSKMQNIPYKDVLQKCKESWPNLSEAEKKKYTNLYESERIKYEIDLAKWEHKMIKTGNEDLVRISTLLQEGKPSHLSEKSSSHLSDKKPKKQ